MRDFPDSPVGWEITTASCEAVGLCWGWQHMWLGQRPSDSSRAPQQQSRPRWGGEVRNSRPRCFKKAHMRTSVNTICSPMLIVCTISAVKWRDVWKCVQLKEQIQAVQTMAVCVEYCGQKHHCKSGNANYSVVSCEVKFKS